MSVPNSEIRIGLAYREVVLLVLSKNPVKMKTELLKFYNEFNNYINFPQKNIEHYALMIRKLVKNEVIYYQENRPVLTPKGKVRLEDILDTMGDTFRNKWDNFKNL